MNLVSGVPPTRFQQYNQPIVEGLLQERRRIENCQPQVTTITDYQIEALLNTRSHFENAILHGKSTPALIVAPTGAGKSGIAALLPYVLGCKKVVILTPWLEITKQLGDTCGSPDHRTSFIYKIGIERDVNSLGQILENVEVVSSKIKDVTVLEQKNLVIVNAQKFGGKSSTSLISEDVEIVRDVKTMFSKFCTIIVDEAHHYTAPTWKRIVDLFEGKQIIFLTGTPFRNNNGRKEAIFDFDPVFSIEREKLEGHTIRCCSFKNEMNRYDVKSDQFYHEVALRVKSILSEHDDREPHIRHQAMILVRTKLDADEVASKFGNVAKCVTSATPKKNSKEFTRGDFRVAVVCGKLKEGYDNSNVSLCVVLRKVTSKLVFEQFVGRCIRMDRNVEREHGQKDATEATVLSYIPFSQYENWIARDYIANVDPQDDYDIED